MADNVITPQLLTRAGATPSYAAIQAEDDHYVPNLGKTWLHFKKSGAGDCDVTIVTTVTVSGLAVENIVVTVPATTGDKIVGPFEKNVFNDEQGRLHFTVDEDTGLTCAAFRLP